MATPERVKLYGNQSLCCECMEKFSVVSTFDAHRVGDWKDRGANRRCLTVPEMLARGWTKNERGFWKTGLNGHHWRLT